MEGCENCPKRSRDMGSFDKMIVNDEMARLYANRLRHYCETHSTAHSDCKECAFRKETEDGEYYCLINFPCDWWI